MGWCEVSGECGRDGVRGLDVLRALALGFRVPKRWCDWLTKCIWFDTHWTCGAHVEMRYEYG